MMQISKSRPIGGLTLCVRRRLDCKRSKFAHGSEFLMRRAGLRFNAEGAKETEKKNMKEEILAGCSKNESLASSAFSAFYRRNRSPED